MTNEINIYFQKAVEVNNALVGAPALVVVFIGCIVFGYVVKAIPFIPNRYIPLCNFAFGIGAYLAMTAGKSIMRETILGMIASASAWVVHYKFLRKWIDDRLFSGDDTESDGKNDSVPTSDAGGNLLDSRREEGVKGPPSKPEV